MEPDSPGRRPVDERSDVVVPTPSARSEDGTLARAVRVLAAFTAPDRELSGAELARRSGLPRSTTHRVAAELVATGLLEQTPAGRLRLGMRLFELGHLALFQRGLRESASPFLADLASVTHETVHLAVLEGLDVVYIDIIRPSGAPVLRSRVGGRLPPSTTGVGKAMLAYSAPELVDAVIAQGLPRLTPYSITDGTRLRAELVEVRRTGLSFDNQEQAIGTICCAAPIFGVGGQLVGAISVSGRLGVLRLDRVKMAVRTAAAGISRLQGHQRLARPGAVGTQPAGT